MSDMLFAQINQPPTSWSSTFFYMMIIAIGLIALMFCIFLAKYFNLWIQAKMTQANVTIWELVGMSFRKVNPNIIVRSKIMAYQAGLSEKDGMTTRRLEAHYLAGGNVPNVVRALIAANRADIPLSYKRAAGDRPGRPQRARGRADERQPQGDPLPRPELRDGTTIDGVAKNGIQLKVKAKVTVRTNLDRLVGGATDETIIARVGEGIVNAIGSADTHKQVLEKPDSISKRVLEKGLDAGTAYEILSIDIADIDVGDNIGANLQALQAEADTRVARAKAEERRAFAVAKEQEMIAHVQENRAKVVQAEAEIPMAIAEAFRKGNLGITDYYNLRNVQADTEMRNAIAGTGNNAARREPVVTPMSVGATSFFFDVSCRSGLAEGGSMRFEILIQFIVPLMFLAIWALTSLLNRDAQPLPPRPTRPPGPGGPRPLSRVPAQPESRASSMGSLPQRSAATSLADQQPMWTAASSPPSRPERAPGRPPLKSLDDAIVYIENDSIKRSAARPGSSPLPAQGASNGSRPRAAQQRKSSRGRGGATGIPSGQGRSEPRTQRVLSDQVNQSMALQRNKPLEITPLFTSMAPLSLPLTQSEAAPRCSRNAVPPTL